MLDLPYTRVMHVMCAWDRALLGMRTNVCQSNHTGNQDASYSGRLIKVVTNLILADASLIRCAQRQTA